MVSHIQVDDGMQHLDDEDVYDFKADFPEYEEQMRHTDMTVSLMDIAKPAARRKGMLSPSGLCMGCSLDFWIVRARKSVMAAHCSRDGDFDDFIELDHDDDFSDFSDDWEDLYSRAEDDRTYSSVLRG
jgi:hypothetical protein